MKQLAIFSKKYSSAWQTIAPWEDEVPYIPPFGLVDIEVEYSVYASYYTQSADVSIVTGTPPATWGAIVGRTLAFTSSGDWISEGFVEGLVIRIMAGKQNPWFKLDIWGIVRGVTASTLTVEVTGIYTEPPTLPFRPPVENVFFIQDHDPLRHAGILVQEPEFDNPSSILNGGSILLPHPHRAKIVVLSTGQATVPPPQSLNFWPLPNWPQVSKNRRRFTIGHFYAMRTALDPSSITQNLYTNRLFFVLSVENAHIKSFELATSQPNRYQNNAVISPRPTLSGSNGAWNLSAPGSQASFVAHHNADGVHTQAAANNVIELLQSGANPTLVLWPPSPKAIGVGVYFSSNSGWGSALSNAEPLLPVPQGGLTVRLHAPVYAVPYQSEKGYAVYPWDTIMINFWPADGQWRNKRVRRVFYSVNLADGREVFSKEINFTPEEIASMPQNMVGFSYEDPSLLAQFSPIEPGAWPTHPRRTNTPARQTFTAVHNSGLKLNVFQVYFPWPLFIHKLYSQTAKFLEAGHSGFTFRIFVLLEYESGEALGGHEVVNSSLQYPYILSTVFSETPSYIIALLRHNCLAYRHALIRGDDLDYYCLAQIVDTDASFPPGWKVSNAGFTNNKVEIPKPTAPGNYFVLIRSIEWDSNNFIINQTCDYYSFTVREPMPLPPAPEPGDYGCRFCMPMLAGEMLLFPEEPRSDHNQPLPYSPAGDWFAWQAPMSGSQCFSRWHCPVDVVSTIPDGFIDFVAEYDNRVWGRAVQGTMTLRFLGVLRRMDDEFSVERYVTKQYNESDIVRAYRAAYEAELLLFSPCQLTQIDLLKYSQRVFVKARQGMTREAKGVLGAVRIRDEQTHYRVTIEIREEAYRKEYRY